jgi:hypothetical protein
MRARHNGAAAPAGSLTAERLSRLRVVSHIRACTREGEG